MKTRTGYMTENENRLHARGFLTPFQAGPSPWFRRKKFYTNLLRRSAAECLASALLMFVSLSASSAFCTVDEDVRVPTPVMVGLAEGLAYAGLMAATAHISGGHLNPAVSLGILISGHLNVLAALFYIIAQFIGSILGAAAVLAYEFDVPHSFGNGSSNSCIPINTAVTSLSKGVNQSQGILVETMLSLLLVMVFIHMTVEETEFKSIAPLVIGLTLAAAVISSYNVTGGSVNPFRSFGPAMIANKWKDHYVYWIGPLCGSCIAGTFYKLLFSSKAWVPLAEETPIQ